MEFYLDVVGAILVIGPKWCGKTTTAMQHAKSVVRLETSGNDSYLRWADIEPSKVLEGEKPRLIDEWQHAPTLWDAVRNSVDDLQEDGLYILTGSTVVDESNIKHSGAGRIHRMMMRPMSLYESNESNGKISLLELFDNPDLNINGIESELTINELIFAICRGGWPSSLGKKTDKAKLSVVYSYLDVLVNEDVISVDEVERDSLLVHRLLQSYSRTYVL